MFRSLRKKQNKSIPKGGGDSSNKETKAEMQKTPLSSSLTRHQQPNKNESDTGSHSRTVGDFQTREDLTQAMMSAEIKGSCNAKETAWLYSNASYEQDLINQDCSVGCPGTNVMDVKDIDQELDWVLENYDENTTKKQTLDDEIRRLLVLKSYLILDTERKDMFDRITEAAKSRFNCPIALISLVDLGRQWLLSSQGLGDVRETPRKHAFCAHAIMSTSDCLIIPDATRDFRFKDNPFVTGDPGIRFYAGAPLVSPEGQKLGTVCVIDTKPRFFTLEERNGLKDMAKMVVHNLVAHRSSMSTWFNDLVRTHFPDFAEVPDAELSDVSEDDEEEQSGGGTEKDLVGEDQEVAAFLETMKRMPLDGLLSMLQIEAREQNLPSEYLQQYTSLAKKFEESPPKASALKKQKKSVKFAEFMDVYQVESWKDLKNELWWSPDDMYLIRKRVGKMVKYYRKKRPDYIQCLSVVAESAESDTVRQVRQLAEESRARGLEPRMVSVLSKNRKLAVQSVLDMQDECRWNEDDYELTCDSLRDESLPNSEFSTQFAKKMAQCDEIDALAATISRWTAGAVGEAVREAPLSPRSTLPHDLSPSVPRRWN